MSSTRLNDVSFGSYCLQVCQRLSDSGGVAVSVFVRHAAFHPQNALILFCVVESARPEETVGGIEMRFQGLLDHAPDLIYRYGVAPSRTLHYINAACRAITGRSQEEFYASPELALTCVHPDDRHLVLDAFQDDPAKLRLAVLLRWIHPDGRVVWAEHRRVPIFDAHGQLVAIEGIGRDVTEAARRKCRRHDLPLPHVPGARY
jgi:PAS domain S-box-containing protein